MDRSEFPKVQVAEVAITGEGDVSVVERNARPVETAVTNTHKAVVRHCGRVKKQKLREEKLTEITRSRKKSTAPPP